MNRRNFLSALGLGAAAAVVAPSALAAAAPKATPKAAPIPAATGGVVRSGGCFVGENGPELVVPYKLIPQFAPGEVVSAAKFNRIIDAVNRANHR